jgi:hypothetical protein
MNIDFIIRELKEWQLRWNPLLLTNWPFSHNPHDLLAPETIEDQSTEPTEPTEPEVVQPTESTESTDEFESLKICYCIIL